MRVRHMLLGSNDAKSCTECARILLLCTTVHTGLVRFDCRVLPPSRFVIEAIALDLLPLQITKCVANYSVSPMSRTRFWIQNSQHWRQTSHITWNVCVGQSKSVAGETTNSTLFIPWRRHKWPMYIQYCRYCASCNFGSAANSAACLSSLYL